MQEKISIVITHFVNPHLFWYYEVGDHTELCEIEQQLQIHKDIRATENPKSGEKVAINFAPWNKLVRAEILCETKWQNEFIAWALDYGIAFRTKNEHIRRLPLGMADQVSRIRRGGVSNILPAEIEYDCMEGNVVMMTKDNWSQKACDVLEKLLMNASSLTFVKEFQSKDNHNWGSLVVENHQGKIFNARESLISAKLALDEAINFKDSIRNLKSTEIPRHLSSSGNLVIKTNAFKKGTAGLCPVENVVTSIDEHTRSKIEDWYARNECQANLSDAESTLESNLSVEVVDDVTFDDSVSAKHENTCKPSDGVVKKMQAGFTNYIGREDTLVKNNGAMKSMENGLFKVKTKTLANSPKSTGKPSIESPINDEDDEYSDAMSSRNVDKESVREEDISNTSKMNITKADEEAGSLFRLKCFKEISQKDSEKNVPDPYRGFTIVPGGFDLSRLNKYRNEKSHWHRKKTTLSNKLNEVTFENNRNPSSSSKKSLNNKSPKDGMQRNGLISRKSVEISDKPKESEQNIIVPSLDDVIKPRKCAVMKSSPPLIVRKPSKEDASANISLAASPTTTASTNSITPDAKICGTRPKLKSTTPTIASGKSQTIGLMASRKQRKLKSPDTQFDKIDKILQKAERAKQLGDENIVDLKFPNTSFERMDPSSTSMLELQFDNNNLYSSSNNRALLENRVNKDKSSTGSNKNENCKNAKANTEQQTYSIVHVKEKQMIPTIKGDREIRIRAPEVLAHSNIPLYPLKTVNDAQFLPQIHKEMMHMRINKIYRVQVFAWSHLLRNNSLFIINPSKSGKTWSYLPVLCNDIYYDVNGMTSTYGPIAIVLVASAKHVEQVTDLCQRLLCGLKDEAPIVVGSFGLRNFKGTKIKLLNSCGILVTTPSSLLRLLRDNQNEHLFDAKRLKRIVVDDIDLLLSRASEDFQTALKALFTMCKKSETKTLNAQMVVTSRCWDFWFVKLMRLANQPLLLIGDFLEASVYGRVEHSIKLRSKLEKDEMILRFLKNCNKTVHIGNRTIIICSDDEEVKRVIGFLTENGHCRIGYYSFSTAAERLIIDEWKLRASTPILVCTDAGLTDLQIRNAHNLIHYSMPTSWTQFTKRFSVLIKSYDNLLCDNFKKILCSDQNANKVRSLILLDEDNNLQLPRLVDFMRMHGQTVHRHIQAVTKSLLNAREEQRVSEGVQLCSDILEYGECNEPRCDRRHGLTRLDVVTENDDIPTHGEIRIHILKVHSPTYYVARLLEHKGLHSKQWSEVRCSRKAALFAVQLHSYYRDPNNREQYWPPQIGDICIYNYLNCYRRARIFEVPSLPKNVNVIPDSLALTLKLIDDGIVITAVQIKEICLCHQKFKDFPHQAIDIRLMNVVPYDNERMWDSAAIKKVQKWIVDDIKDNQVVHVSVNFALASTIWIDKLVVMERLNAIGTYRQLIDLKLTLFANELALQYKGDRKNVCDIAKEYGLLKLPPPVPKIGHNSNVNDESSLISINSPAGNLTNEDQIETSPQINENANKKEKVVNHIGKKQEEISEPGPNEDKLENESGALNKSTSFYNQTIHFKESWSELPLNELVKVEIGDEDENGNWENMFVQLIDPISTRTFNQLIELIDKHVHNMKAIYNNNHPKIYDFQPLHNCIVKYNNLYLRAKVHCIFGNEISERLYRFFLCDYACFINVKSGDLYKDFLYETSEEIVNFIPYQAIHCHLAGIQWDRFTKRHKVCKQFLYVYAVQQNSKKSQAIFTLCKFPINSYIVLFYECEEEGDFTHASLFNKVLLENGVTVADPETKHFLNSEIDFEIKELNERNPQHEGAIDKPVTFNELLECIKKCNALDAVDFIELKDEKTEISGAEATTSEEPKLINGIDKLSEENEQEKKEKLTPSLQDKHRLPPLKVLHKRPRTTWHQNGYLIFLSIHVPDIKDYYLKVGKDQLHFAAEIHGEENILILNLLGAVAPKLVSHELLGLNVIVRLVKCVYITWPRLLKDPGKFGWLSYDYNFIDVREIDGINPTPLNYKVASDEITDSESDTEQCLFHTYNRTENCEDDDDPFS
ncbi:putative ATP-dependent RNA helicase TDRD12 [Glossina fuscipes]|uniref:RNA helicase n=1 Tax=Glossina fuscipes TaxID=7396 RepID=A0A9C5YV27_9MUSC|nr:putative ATP-dependent RNA helicase TDRD12 [Glossina fuscipes]